MKAETKKKAIKYLYEKGVNNASRKKTFPKDNEEILKPISIDVVNVGVKSLENQMFVRVSFVGSGKYYELGIQSDRWLFWTEFCKNCYIDKPDIDFLDEEYEDDYEEEEYDEFAQM